jgi:pimeloyl-ACP methyl ester carboxylesterase
MRTTTAVSNDGTRIGWVTVGAGEPVLLVHGGAADHTRLEAFAAWLSDRYEMHLVDRRGRGLSSDGAEYSIEREYDDVAAVAESIGNGMTVFGHSYAGPIVLGAALRGDAIARAICYEGWPAVTGGPNWYHSTGDVPAKLQALIDAGDDDGAVAMTFREIVGLSDEQVASMRGRPEWAGRLAAVHTLPRELRTEASITLSGGDLRSITASVLFLIGGQNQDRLVPQARQLCTFVRHARIAVLPGQGHMAMDTAPEMLAAAITTFIDSTPRSVGRSARGSEQ